LVTAHPRQLEATDAEYVYLPDQLEGMLDANALRNVLLCLAHQDLDFIVVSHGLADPPALEVVTARNALVLSAGAHQTLDRTGRLPPGAGGRIVRIVPGRLGGETSRIPLGGMRLGELAADGPELRAPGVADPVSPRRPSAALFRGPAPARPTILVLPIMVAVGGAERNLIEVLRALRGRYNFVVATTERLSAAWGSLNHEILDYCDALFELGELAPQSEFLTLLGSLAASFSPDLVFITNGSPWLQSHTRALRDLFRDVPIVDQQVYDTREGWIEFYDDPGLQSFDRFVAINDRIRRVFEERFHLDPARIDLIYHAIDDARFSLGAADACDRTRGRAGAGLPEGKLVFAQVGRLVPQKRPLDFLALARAARDAGLSDHFLLVGDGELAPNCERFIKEHRLDAVTRIPFCPDMSRLLPLLEGVVFTSGYEGLPIAMLEALAMGLPVLANDVGDIRLVLEEYGAGRVVEPIGSLPALFEAFQGWRSDLEGLREHARRAAPRIGSRFGAGAVAERYAGCFERALEARRRVGSEGSVEEPGR
jgi:glycosyltransferase involved in cell wall biosynthesis